MEKSKQTKSKSSKTEKRKIVKTVAKVLNKGHFSKYLMGMNPYALTILDPFNIRGVRIPDIVTMPSVPFSITRRITLTANANGVCGIMLGAAGRASDAYFASLIPVFQNNVANDYLLGQILGSAATVTDLVAGVRNGTGPTDLRHPQWNSNTSPVVNLFTMVRLVSCGLMVEYVGQALNAQGKFTLVSAPRLWLNGNGLANTLPLNTLLTAPGCTTVPIPSVGKGSVLYRPQDNVSLQYWNTTTTAVNIATNPAGFQGVFGGELYAIADGMVANQTILATFVFNYEAIPAVNTFTYNLFESSPSYHDPIALSHATNVAAEAPMTIADVPKTLAQTNPAASAPKEELVHHEPHPDQDGLGMFGKVLDSIPGLIDKGSKIVEKVTPFASALLSLI